MGSLAGVAVSSGGPAVLGPPPDRVSLAPTPRCPRSLPILPSASGRCSAAKSENRCMHAV